MRERPRRHASTIVIVVSALFMVPGSLVADSIYCSDGGKESLWIDRVLALARYREDPSARPETLDYAQFQKRDQHDLAALPRVGSRLGASVCRVVKSPAPERGRLIMRYKQSLPSAEVSERGGRAHDLYGVQYHAKLVFGSYRLGFLRGPDHGMWIKTDGGGTTRVEFDRVNRMSLTNGRIHVSLKDGSTIAGVPDSRKFQEGAIVGEYHTLIDRLVGYVDDEDATTELFQRIVVNLQDVSEIRFK